MVSQAKADLEVDVRSLTRNTIGGRTAHNTKHGAGFDPNPWHDTIPYCGEMRIERVVSRDFPIVLDHHVAPITAVSGDATDMDNPSRQDGIHWIQCFATAVTFDRIEIDPLMKAAPTVAHAAEKSRLGHARRGGLDIRLDWLTVLKGWVGRRPYNAGLSGKH